MIIQSPFVRWTIERRLIRMHGVRPVYFLLTTESEKVAAAISYRGENDNEIYRPCHSFIHEYSQRLGLDDNLHWTSEDALGIWLDAVVHNSFVHNSSLGLRAMCPVDRSDCQRALALTSIFIWMYVEFSCVIFHGLKQDLQLCTIFAGTTFGSFTGGTLADKFRRTKTFQLDAIPVAIGIFLCATTQRVQTLIIDRLLAGIGIGISFAIVPLYISERMQDSMERIPRWYNFKEGHRILKVNSFMQRRTQKWELNSNMLGIRIKPRSRSC